MYVAIDPDPDPDPLWARRRPVSGRCWSTSVSLCHVHKGQSHYDDVMIGAMASQITSLTIVYSTVYSGADQSKHQSSASLAFVWGIHRWPVNSPHKWPATRKMFPFDDVIMPQLKFLWRGRSADITLSVSWVTAYRWIPLTKCQGCKAIKFSLILTRTNC